MLKPWEIVAEEPRDLPCAEVTLTAFIQIKCRSEYADKVRCEFQWFGASSALEHVDASVVHGWERSPDDPGSSAEAADAAAPAAGERQGAAVLVHAQFQLKSSALKATCAFVRVVAETTLRVRVHFPAPDWKPGVEPSPPPTGEPNPKAKAKAEPKDKKKADAAAVPAYPEVTAEVVLQLAPLLLAGCSGAHGLEIFQDGNFGCKGVESFRVGVRCDKKIVSDQVAWFLNPMLVTFEAAHQLPREQHLGQKCDQVYGVVKAFGGRFLTTATSISPKGKAHFNYHKVFFVGPWHRRQLRDYLQSERLVIEVHDRDADPAAALAVGDQPALVPGKSKSPSPAASPTAGDGPGAGAADAEGRAAQQPAYGVVWVPLAELLNPNLKHPLDIRADLQPVSGVGWRRQKGNVSGGGGASSLKAASLFEEGAKEVIASLGQITYDVVPGFTQSGAYIRVEVALSRPLHIVEPSSPKAAEQKQQQEAPAQAEGEKPAEVAEPPDMEDETYERYSRLLFVLDYRKSIIMKKLLFLVSSINVNALQLDSGQARALTSVQLTDEQLMDQNLDIVTGFVILDRYTRIVMVEGLRHKAMRQIIDTLGIVDLKCTRQCKVLFHPDLCFSQRLYGQFNLCLKQIKLRQPTLESLTYRPELCLTGRCEPDVSTALHQLTEIKRATRLHMLKSNGSFPSAQGLIAIETQYGDFVADKELAGGCVNDDTKSQASKASGTTSGSQQDSQSHSKNSKCAEALAVAAAQALATDEDDEDVGADDAATIPGELSQIKQRISLRAPLDSANRGFLRTLAERATQPPRNSITCNIEALQAASAQIADTEGSYTNRKRAADTSFLEGKGIYIYSGQKLNSAELQKQHLRASMQQADKLWTYSADKNSGCFPLTDEEVTADNLMRETVILDDGREPWRYPKQREKADFKKLSRDVSDARKEELQSPWIENQMFPESEKKEIVLGAFDAKALGTGGAHVIPARRPGLPAEPYAPPEPAKEAPPGPPMKFKGRCNVGQENVVDKYHSGILHGEPQAFGLRFTDRRPPHELAKKYGKGPGTANVEQPPVSIALAEPWQDANGTSDCLTSFMKTVARPIVDRRPPSAPHSARGPGRPAAAAAERTPVEPLAFTTVKPKVSASPAQARVWNAMLAAGRGDGTGRATRQHGARSGMQGERLLAPLSAR
mmetsp:Transcript_66727/g.217203  ORF Transcript_66727/g.217203 Transcript_66727/m.217203 type:complete len:1176 (-) Transcript_66727:66-3593(-)